MFSTLVQSSLYCTYSLRNSLSGQGFSALSNVLGFSSLAGRVSAVGAHRSAEVTAPEKIASVDHFSISRHSFSVTMRVIYFFARSKGCLYPSIAVQEFSGKASLLLEALIFLALLLHAVAAFLGGHERRAWLVFPFHAI